jgi:hypothetical protein
VCELPLLCLRKISPISPSTQESGCVAERRASQVVFLAVEDGGMHPSHHAANAHVPDGNMEPSTQHPAPSAQHPTPPGCCLGHAWTRYASVTQGPNAPTVPLDRYLFLDSPCHDCKLGTKVPTRGGKTQYSTSWKRWQAHIALRNHHGMPLMVILGLLL